MTPPRHLHWLSCKNPWWRKPNDGHFHWLAVCRRLFVHECLTKTGKRITRGCASPPELLLQASWDDPVAEVCRISSSRSKRNDDGLSASNLKLMLSSYYRQPHFFGQSFTIADMISCAVTTILTMRPRDTVASTRCRELGVPENWIVGEPVTDPSSRARYGAGCVHRRPRNFHSNFLSCVRWTETGRHQSLDFKL